MVKDTDTTLFSFFFQAKRGNSPINFIDQKEVKDTTFIVRYGTLIMSKKETGILI